MSQWESRNGEMALAYYWKCSERMYWKKGESRSVSDLVLFKCKRFKSSRRPVVVLWLYPERIKLPWRIYRYFCSRRQVCTRKLGSNIKWDFAKQRPDRLEPSYLQGISFSFAISHKVLENLSTLIEDGQGESQSNLLQRNRKIGTENGKVCWETKCDDQVCPIALTLLCRFNTEKYL